MGATGGVTNDVGPSHQLHEAHEPIVPRSQDLIEGAEKHPKVRKIAAGPALPHYKGKNYMGLDARNPVFGGLRTTMAQTSLFIRAV